MVPSGLLTTVSGPGTARSRSPASWSVISSPCWASSAATRSSSRSRAAGEMVVAVQRAGQGQFGRRGLPLLGFPLRLGGQPQPVRGRVRHPGRAAPHGPVPAFAQRHRDRHRLGVPPRGRRPDPRIGLLRPEQQMPGRIGAERRVVEPVRLLVVCGREPAGQPQEVGPPRKSRPGGVQQPLGVGDQLAQRLARGAAELLRPGCAVRGVVPGGQLLPVRPRAALEPARPGCRPASVRPGSVASAASSGSARCEHQAGPVRDGRGVPVDVSGDQVDVDQQQLLELRVLLAGQVVPAEDRPPDRRRSPGRCP